MAGGQQGTSDRGETQETPTVTGKDDAPSARQERWAAGGGCSARALSYVWPTS